MTVKSWLDVKVIETGTVFDRLPQCFLSHHDRDTATVPENRIFSYPPHSTLPLGWSASEYCHPVW